MTFDSITLAAVAAELNSTLAGGRVDKVQQPSPLDVVLTIRNNQANYSLLVSAEAQSPRVHMTSIRRPNPQTPPNFCMLMRKYLEGARLVEVQQIDFDRILHLKFSAYDGERLTLVIEIMGKHSNVVLINDTQKILGTVKPVGRSKNRYREILPGRDYVAPPPQNKVNPLQVTREQFDSLFADTFSGAESCDVSKVASWLTKTFTGVSPFAARELAARADGDPAKLGDEFVELFVDVKANRYMPVLIADDMGRTIGFYVFPSLQYPESNQHERSSVNTLADLFYNSALPRQQFEQSRDEFLSRVRRELEAREHTLEMIRQSISAGDKAERLKQLGELILSQMASVPAEAESAELVDYYDPDGGTVVVELDPQLSPSENAEAYFTKYHKAITGAEAMRDRLVDVEGEVSLLRKVQSRQDSIASVEQVKELAGLLEDHGISLRRQEAASDEKRKPEFDGYRISKVESNGWEILVGQNSESNDYLLTRVAKPNDLWLHVKASPSAHVVIRTNGKPDSVPRSVLQMAAELTARHSDQKHSSLIPVDYTLKKYVRKQKGGPAGKALYTHEKTLFITPT